MNKNQSNIISSTKLDENLSNFVLDTLRKCFASLHEKAPDDVNQFLIRVKSSKKVLNLLEREIGNTYKSIFEALNHETTVSSGVPLNLYYLPILALYRDNVKNEIKEIQKYIGTLNENFDFHGIWADVVEIVQRDFTKKKTKELLTALENNSDLEYIMKKFKDIEAPTTRKAESRKKQILTADRIIAEINSKDNLISNMRFSSGLPTLDKAYTNPGETLGFIAPGQLVVIMGPTGTGKSSFSYSITPSFGLDLKNWGLNDALQVMWHTEEESIDKIKAFRMGKGMPYNHLSKNLIVDAIGTSRRRMVELLYDLVIEADEKSRKSNRPITDFLPYICQLDYIQSISEQGEDEKESTKNTAEFLLRGVCAWNPDEMAKITGVDFREYAGMAWPSGMENHRVAVVAYAQLVKINEDSLYYKKDKKNIQISDFAKIDENGKPYWDVKEGDLRLFDKNQMRGSGVIAQNAHAILILHRSVPINSSKKDSKHLDDTRARILFDKARTGITIPYAPMRFDVQDIGGRAQYYDELAEIAIQKGIINDYHDSYKKSGDPILPKRGYVNPLENYIY